MGILDRYRKAFRDILDIRGADDLSTIPGVTRGPGEMSLIGNSNTDIDDLFGLGVDATSGRNYVLHDYSELIEPGVTNPNRFQRLVEMDELDNVDLASALLDTYAAEAGMTDHAGNAFRVKCSNKDAQLETKFLLSDIMRFNENREWLYRNLCKYGESFHEHVIDPDNPQLGIVKVKYISPDTMHRIETVKGTLIEFQQTAPGAQPDLHSVRQDVSARPGLANGLALSLAGVRGAFVSGHRSHSPVGVIRLHPRQITHIKIGEYRKGFHPYGVPILYPGRRAARMLKILEDAMVVYRLSRAPERRAFFIDVGNLSGNAALSFLEKIKAGLKKKKIFNERTGSVDERWNPMSQDEDFWIPIRPNSTSRIDTLPGAANLGEVNDVLWFEHKLLKSVKMPPWFLGATWTTGSPADAANGRMTTSSTYVAFAQRIEAIQLAMAKGLREMAVTHLLLKGFPLEEIHDLRIEMVPPNDYREAIRRESLDARISIASNANSLGTYSRRDLLIKFMGEDPNDVDAMIRAAEEDRLRLQKLDAGEDPDSPIIPKHVEEFFNSVPKPEEQIVEEPQEEEAEPVDDASSIGVPPYVDPSVAMDILQKLRHRGSSTNIEE